jgi:hypothetical protein
MTTAIARDLEADHHESEERPALGLQVADTPRQELPPDSFDPTQGRQIGSQPYDDPTHGRTIGSDPYDDPSHGRTIGSDPYDDPTHGRQIGSDPYDDPSQGVQIGSDAYDDPTRAASSRDLAEPHRSSRAPG